MAVKTMDLGQVAGSSAYQEAQAGGYTGTKEEFQEDLAGIGDAGKAFIINGGDYDSNDFTPNKTKDEILAAIQAGKRVILRRIAVADKVFSDYLLASCNITDTSTYFYFTAIGNTSVVVAYIYCPSDPNFSPQGSYRNTEIPGPATAAPKAPGIASAGTGSAYARSDHVHPKETKSLTIILYSDSWNPADKIQISTVSGVTSSNTVLAAPSPSSQDDYTKAGVKCMEQQTNSLVFSCETIPTFDLVVNIVII